MIRKLHVTGFKRFAECSLAFEPLTVLTGTNGAGKTSVIQTLLLAREASRTGTRAVQLNGPFGLQLGAAQDVLNVHTALEQSEITIQLSFDDGAAAPLRYALDASEESLLYLPILERPADTPRPLGGSDQDFTYLCAERLGPRDVLQASALPGDQLGVGVQGEYCAQVLSLRELKEKVPLDRRHPQHTDEVDAFLKYQVEAWLSTIVRPVEIRTEWFPNTSMTALRFRSPGGEWVRAPNMGFGVSYALPIILAGLATAVGSIVIVENPEAHLHPAGQSRMGVFLAQLAASGVQVLLETHSDHVLNGIRRAIGEHRVLGSNDAIVHFFDMEAESNPTIAALHFTDVGGLSDWPPRFFDQFQLDVAALARVRRHRSR